MRAIDVTRYTYHLVSSRDEDPVVIVSYDDKSDVGGEVFASRRS